MSRVRFILGALVVGLFVGTIACGGGGTEIRVGQSVTGTITASDTDDGEWKSQTYVIEVREGIRYRFDLSTSTEDTVGIWNEERYGYIVEVNLIVGSRSGYQTFSETGPQKLYLQSPKYDVPSQFTFSVVQEP
jgi:hypothetical protein